jgi:hypothetical protein
MIITRDVVVAVDLHLPRGDGLGVGPATEIVDVAGPETDDLAADLETVVEVVLVIEKTEIPRPVRSQQWFRPRWRTRKRRKRRKRRSSPTAQLMF